MIGTLTDRILHLHGWAALAIVFLVPALEASAFVGFVFPGEIAVLLGGVLAYQHRISLPAAIGAAVLGAVLGDAAGYLIGRRWGRTLLRGTIGHLPVIRHHLERSLDRAQEYVRRRRGRAVFFGRFTAALRVLVPGLAGMSRVPFPTFLAYNAAGGAIWGTGFVLLGYAAGAGWRHVERYAGQAGLALLALVVLALILARLGRDVGRLHRWGDRLAAAAPLAWVRRRFPRQVAWARRRVDPLSPAGFPLSFALAVAGLAGWVFGGVTQDVVGHDETARFDPRVEHFLVTHRQGWLTGAMKSVAWLGSDVVLIPIAAAFACWWLWRRRDWRPGAKVALSLGGASALVAVVKTSVTRPRPPVPFRLLGVSGSSFPSGHATQAAAALGAVAILLTTGWSIRARAAIWAGAGLIVFAVGAAGVYLGIQWFTDELAGWALGAAWLSVVVAAFLLAASRPRPVRDDGTGSPPSGGRPSPTAEPVVRRPPQPAPGGAREPR